MKKISLIIIAAIFFIGCEKDANDSMNPNQTSYNANDFFFYQLNDVLNYRGDSIVYNNFSGSIDTSIFYYKDSLINIDTANEVIHYEFERYYAKENKAFSYLKNYSIYKSAMGIIESVNLKSMFLLPGNCTKSSTWNYNQYNDLEYQECSIRIAEQKVYETALRNLLTVKQLDEVNLIREDKAEMQFASGIGKIYEYKRGVDKDISTGQIKSGTILTLVYIP